MKSCQTADLYMGVKWKALLCREKQDKCKKGCGVNFFYCFINYIELFNRLNKDEMAC